MIFVTARIESAVDSAVERVKVIKTYVASGYDASLMPIPLPEIAKQLTDGLAALKTIVNDQARDTADAARLKKEASDLKIKYQEKNQRADTKEKHLIATKSRVNAIAKEAKTARDKLRTDIKTHDDQLQSHYEEVQAHAEDKGYHQKELEDFARMKKEFENEKLDMEKEKRDLSLWEGRLRDRDIQQTEREKAQKTRSATIDKEAEKVAADSLQLDERVEALKDVRNIMALRM